MTNSFVKIQQQLSPGVQSRFVRLGGHNTTDSVEKSLKKLDFDTIIFVGSGAVENGWLPIQNLFDEIISGTFGGPVSWGSQNNPFFYGQPFDHTITSIAFLETVFRSRLARMLEDTTFNNSESYKIYKGAIDTREKMAHNFSNEKSLKLRHLDTARFKINLEKTLVVTSNWDNCIWDNSDFKNLIYLHGHCEIKNSLVMPTQFATDEFPLKHWIDLRLQQNDTKVQTVRNNVNLIAGNLKALPNFISKGQRDLQQELNFAHDLFREAISVPQLKRLIIWGYGFNLYDAEVNTLLTMASVRHAPTVEVLNPDSAVLTKASQVLARDIKTIALLKP